jgi:hypothetical protein
MKNKLRHKDSSSREFIGKCEICRKKKTVTVAPDAYSSELYDDKTPRQLCSECRAARAEDI